MLRLVIDSISSRRIQRTSKVGVRVTMGVLVTGGAGYIGSHMTWALLDRGETVVVLDNLLSGQQRLVPPKAAFVEGNAGDQQLVRHLIWEHGIDAILHFAGSIVVPESVAQPLAY